MTNSKALAYRKFGCHEVSNEPHRSRFTIVLTSSQYYVPPLVQGGLEISLKLKFNFYQSKKLKGMIEGITWWNHKFITVLKALLLVLEEELSTPTAKIQENRAKKKTNQRQNGLKIRKTGHFLLLNPNQ